MDLIPPWDDSVDTLSVSCTVSPRGSDGQSAMDKQQLIERLTLGGFEVSDDSRMAHGCRLQLTTGAIICLYDSGKIIVQGKNQEPVKALLGVDPAAAARPATASVASRKVFVVYGHDGPARTELEAMLRRWSLEPLILDQLPSAGQTIIEKLESVRKEATFAVILATTDDEGHRAGKDDEKSFRARQNVVLELGMMLAFWAETSRGDTSEKPG